MIIVKRISPTDYSKIPTGVIDMTREDFITAHSLTDEGPEGDVVATVTDFDPRFSDGREFFSVTEHVKSEISTVTAQKLTSSYVRFQVIETETTRDSLTGQVLLVQVIAILNGQFAGFFSGPNFDKAKGAAWESICNERGLNINDGSPDYDRYIAHQERQHHAALDAAWDDKERLEWEHEHDKG